MLAETLLLFPALLPQEAPAVAWRAFGAEAAAGAADEVAFEAQGTACCHGPRLAVSDGRLVVAWNEHPQDEGAPGQSVRLAARSSDGAWGDAVTVLPALGEVVAFGGVGYVQELAGLEPAGDELVVLSEVRHLRGWTDVARTKERLVGAPQRYNYEVFEDHGWLARRVRGGVPVGEPFWVGVDEAPDPDFGFTGSEDPPPAARAAAERARARAEALADLPEVIEGRDARLLDPTAVTLGDGTELRFFRDDLFRRQLFLTTRGADGGAWSAASPTDVPDSTQRAVAGLLPDGRVFLAGTQLAPRGRYEPLTLTVAGKGLRFEEAYLLRAKVRDDEPELVRPRRPKGFEAGDVLVDADAGALRCAYSVRGARISVITVPLAALAPPSLPALVVLDGREPFRRTPSHLPPVALDLAGADRDRFDLPLLAVAARAGDVVGDVGCGRGRYTLPLAKAVGPHGRVFAREVSLGAVEEVRRRAEAAGLAHVDVAPSEPGDVRIPPDTLDVALLSDVHQLVHRRPATRAAFLASLRRALKPGGVVVVTYVTASFLYEPALREEEVAATVEDFLSAGFEPGRRLLFEEVGDRVAGGSRPAYVLEFRRPE